jgi:hypothetical protein
LAEGADRLFTREVLGRHRNAQLEAILPMPRDIYAAKAAEAPAAQAELEDLLQRACSILEPSHTDADEPDATAFTIAERRLVARSDILIALWDGSASGGGGGTAETLAEAAWRGKPCIWISTEAPHAVVDNLGGESARAFYRRILERAAVEMPVADVLDDDPPLEPLTEAYEALDAFNRAPLRHLDGRRANADTTPDRPYWVGPQLRRAQVLAQFYRWWFGALAFGISASAALAAVMLAFSLIDSENRGRWALAEAVFLILGTCAFFVVRWFHFHSHWLSCRVLAERLRAARALAPTGIDYPRDAPLEDVFVERDSADWVTRAIEQVWETRPQAHVGDTLDDETLQEMKATLLRGWIDGQIEYHVRALRRHRTWGRWLTVLATVAFLLAIPVAFGHAIGWWESPSVFLSITLPGLAASLGALVTLRQHHALAQRSSQMSANLASVKLDILRARTFAELQVASSRAARSLAGESGDWLGAMWFLDVEHPG